MDLFINIGTAIVLGLVGLVFLNEMRLANKKEIQDEKYKTEAHKQALNNNEQYIKIRNSHEKSN